MLHYTVWTDITVHTNIVVTVYMTVYYMCTYYRCFSFKLYWIVSKASAIYELDRQLYDRNFTTDNFTKAKYFKYGQDSVT